MKLFCCAKGCGPRSRFKDKSIILHKFPRNPVLCSQWIKNLGREDFIPRRTARLCSKHFKVDCFARKIEGNTCLKSTAVPTIFNFKTDKDGSTVMKNSPNINNISLEQGQPSNLVDTDKDGSTVMKNSPNINKISLEQEQPSNLVDTPINEVSIIDDDNASFKDEAMDSTNEISLGKVTYMNDEIRLGLERADKLVKLQFKKICRLRGNYKCLRARVKELNNILEVYKKLIHIPPEVLKQALAKNKKKVVEPTVNKSSSLVNESCDNSVQGEEALASKEIIAKPTVNISSSAINENCDNLVPNSSFNSYHVNTDVIM